MTWNSRGLRTTCISLVALCFIKLFDLYHEIEDNSLDIATHVNSKVESKFTYSTGLGCPDKDGGSKEFRISIMHGSCIQNKEIV